MIDKSTDRINGYLKQFQNLKIWIISKTKEQAKLYWKCLSGYLNYSEKPVFLSKAVDGLNPNDAVILLCGEWYFNPIADTLTFKYYLHGAKKTFQFGEPPMPKEVMDKYHM